LGRLAANFIFSNEGEIVDIESGRRISGGDIGNIIAAACLAHDIGNPPFGHSGEKAIGRYFKRLLFENPYNFTDSQLTDLCKYEGNASGFRILTNDHPSTINGGLRLTFTTLASFSKYPKESKKAIAYNKLGSSIGDRHSQEKYGFFQQEAGIFEKMTKECSLPRLSDSNLAWARHPLAFLTEAADTICYRCIDIEDAYKLKILSYNDAKDLLYSISENPDDPCNIEDILKIPNNDEQIGALRSKAVNALIYAAISSFKEL